MKKKKARQYRLDAVTTPQWAISVKSERRASKMEERLPGVTSQESRHTLAQRED